MGLNPACTFFFIWLPLNIGASFHTPRPPMEVYWPREHSSRNKGMPANISVKKYGIKKAPKKKKKQF